MATTNTVKDEATEESSRTAGIIKQYEKAQLNNFTKVEHRGAAAVNQRVKSMSLNNVWIEKGLKRNSTGSSSSTRSLLENSSTEGINQGTTTPTLNSKKLSSSSALGVSASNHTKRLGSEMCRQEWIPAKRSGSSISLSTLAVFHSKRFPLNVMVIKGVEDKIPSMRIMNVHFLKHTSVIHVVDTVDRHYQIPCNSTVQLGIIYNPRVKNEIFFFEKVSDIIQSQDLPKVITCTKRCKGRDGGSGVNPDEVLIVIEVVKGPTKSSKKTKLKVFSFTKKKEKLLSCDIIGRFTTDPKLAKLYIPDILQHIPNPFPLTARLYYEKSTDHPPLPDILAKELIVLLDNTVEKSIIASLSLDSELKTAPTNIKELDIIELPVRTDIEIMVVDDKQTQLSNIEALVADTKTIWKSMLTSDNLDTPRLVFAEKDSVQHQLLLMVQEGIERQGQAIVVPPLVKDLLADVDGSNYEVLHHDEAQTSSQHTPHLSNSSSMGSIDDVESASRELRETDGQEADKINMKMKSSIQTKHKNIEYHSTHRLVRRIEALEFKVATTAPQNIVHRLSRRIESLESRSPSELPLIVEHSSSEREKSDRENMLEKEVGELRMALESLKDEVKEMQISITGLLSESMAKEETKEIVALSKQERDMNILKLKEMDTLQIEQLLEALQLSEYKKVFIEEMVNGEILAECDEEVLALDLGIKNKTHLSKLMAVIKGETTINR